MWCSLVNESVNFTSRWGAGLNADYFDLGSFESVHSYCVAPRRFTNPDGTFRYAETYKFDFLLDSKQSAATLLSEDMLITCQGFHTSINGVLHVGFQRPFFFHASPTTEKQVLEDTSGGESTMQVKFVGRSDQPNRVMVQYRDVLNEYMHDYAEASDEADINFRSKVQEVQIAAEGCGRFDSADFLAKSVLDQITGARRQVQFSAPYFGWLIAPTDVIEVTNRQMAINGLICVVNSITEESDKKVQIMALEHRPTLGGLIAHLIPTTTPPGSGPEGSGIGTNNCLNQTCALDGTIAWFNGGANYPAGTLTVSYVRGAYSPANDGSWGLAVAGFDVITRDSGGAITILCPAPGLTVSAPGWSTEGDAEDANQGQSASFVLAASGPIGLQRASGGQSYAGDSFVPPVYQLCTQ